MHGEWDGFCFNPENLNAQLRASYGFPNPLTPVLPTAWANPYQVPNPASFNRQL